jgi:hypothetical protein
MKVKKLQGGMTGLFPASKTKGVISVGRFGLWFDVSVVSGDSVRFPLAFLSPDNVAYHGVVVKKFQDWGKLTDAVISVLGEGNCQVAKSKKRKEAAK